MKTEILKTDGAGLARATKLLRSGEVIAIPTETVYGLAALPEYTAKLNELKDSPADKPITWLTRKNYSEDESINKLLADHATVIVKYQGNAQGFRIPANQFALDLLTELNMPLACTSANMSGGEPAQDAAEVLRVFDGRIAAVVDGGRCEVGVPSAVVDMTVSPPKVLRHGSGLEKLTDILQ